MIILPVLSLLGLFCMVMVVVRDLYKEMDINSLYILFGLSVFTSIFPLALAIILEMLKK